MSNQRPDHPARELPGSAADAADELASWVTGHKPDRAGVNGLLGWITGRRRQGNSTDHLASWITGRKPP